ncbi:MAG: DUF5110 domain-containing protein, partial [Bacteroidales bacterium]|nr:DUF5110 domain-containing protein [Bacteroidales bacterium]
TEIQFRWNDRTRQLTIGERKGQFPGMLQQRRFTIVLPGQDASAGRTIDYAGQELKVSL